MKKLIFLLLILTSCATPSFMLSDKPCKVITKKQSGGSRYYSYKLVTLFSHEPVYLMGFKTDANVGDTVIVTRDCNGKPLIKQGI